MIINNEEELIILKKLEMAMANQIRCELEELNSQNAVVSRQGELV